MPNITNVVLKDDALADVTYSPITETDGIFSLENNTDGRSAFAKKLTMSARRVASTGVHVVTCKLTLPVIEPDQNANDQVVGMNIVDVKFRLNPRSSTSLRGQLRQGLISLTSDSSLVAGAIDDAVGIF